MTASTVSARPRLSPVLPRADHTNVALCPAPAFRKVATVPPASPKSPDVVCCMVRLLRFDEPSESRTQNSVILRQQKQRVLGLQCAHARHEPHGKIRLVPRVTD